MSIKVEIRNNRVYTETPFNREFVSEAKGMGGKWDAEAKAWHFDVRDETRARELLTSIFGTDGSSTETVTVEVTATTRLYEHNAPIIMAGREIATAFGRDSGAKPGADIVFTTRKPQSGGSMKNWTTAIEACTVFEIRDLAITAVKMLDDVPGIEYRIVTDELDSQAAAEAELAKLITERDRIDARIAELQQQIGK
jgi:hypothetical protein